MQGGEEEEEEEEEEIAAGVWRIGGKSMDWDCEGEVP